MANKRVLGALYEMEAIKHLESIGYECIQKNYYTPKGEIDLIMRKDNILYFVEVKFRSSNAYGSPRESITHKKLETMKYSAMHYIKKEHSEYIAFKISFIGITKKIDELQFDFIENIFS